MKFRCRCGNVIPDNTDYLPYKAQLIADQDWFDFLETALRRTMHPHTRTMYQCWECQRLYINDADGRLHCFRPEKTSEVEGFLGSKMKERWKGILTAHWRERSIFPGFPQGTVSFDHTKYPRFRRFYDVGEVENYYYELLDDAKAKNIIRSALLSINGETIHSWSE